VTLRLAVAAEIARHAFAEGESRGVVNMSVVVTDAGGHVRLAMRADGQGIFGIDTATGKARTALGFNRTSLHLSKIFTDAAAVAAITAATGGAFVPLGGGVAVKDAGGTTIGAAAVSGGLPEADEEIIVAAVEAVGLEVLR
jgi:uncharacterized protein GlcG (DUF336 family)